MESIVLCIEVDWAYIQGNYKPKGLQAAVYLFHFLESFYSLCLRTSF